MKPGKILKVYPNEARGGKIYLRTRLGDGPSYYVHRLVLLAFAGVPPDGKGIACHHDDDGTNNRIDNLEWGSQSFNCKMRGKVGQQDMRPEDVPEEQRGDGWEASE